MASYCLFNVSLCQLLNDKNISENTENSMQITTYVNERILYTCPNDINDEDNKNCQHVFTTCKDKYKMHSHTV